VFWVRDFSNIALLATVTVSSENTSTTQLGIKAVDGQMDASFDQGGYSKEWVTNSETMGAWINLNWNQSYLVDKIILYDRINMNDWITGGTLYFSDGTSMKVGTLSNNGAGTVIMFPPKRISWVKFVIEKCQGDNIGLAEFEVYPANIARYASVSVSSENIKTGQTRNKAIDGYTDGLPSHPGWGTTGQLSGAWLKLTWKEPHLVDKVILYDRPSQQERIIKGTLSFSDGSSIPISALSNNGTGNTFTFEPRNITWLKFTVDSAIGSNAGLAEIEVFEAW